MSFYSINHLNDFGVIIENRILHRLSIILVYFGGRENCYIIYCFYYWNRPLSVKFF